MSQRLKVKGHHDLTEQVFGMSNVSHDKTSQKGLTGSNDIMMTFKVSFTVTS